MKRLQQVWRLACIAALAFSQGVAAQSANSVYAKAAGSVGIVIVTTFEDQLVGSGSAVTVAAQTMVTNRHVLLPGHRYQVLANGGRHEAYMTSCDSVQDLCLLEVHGLNAQPVEFADAGKLSVGDAVYAIGAPNEIANILGVAAVTKQKSYSPPQLTLSNGLITALRPVEDGNVIQTNAAISPGSSGGGLFDAQGRLVGITTFGMRSGQGLNMALPVNWVERLGVSGAPRSVDGPAPQAAIAERIMQSPPSAPSSQAAETTADNMAPAMPQERTTRPASGDSGGLLQYGWAALPLLLIGMFMLRRRRAGMQEEDESLMPVAIDPALQRCMAAAAQELEQNSPDATLWSYMIADHKGNMEAARESYIQRRGARLLSEEKDKQWAAAIRESQTT